MYPISSTALAKFQSGAMQYARITNGNTTITNANIVQGGMSINRYVATGESVSVGSCVAAELSLVLSNRDGSWNSYSFDGKEFFVEVGVYTSASTITYIPMGYFTVDEVKFDRNTVTLAALDRMVKFDDAIDLTQFTFPYTLKTLLERICTVCGVPLGTTGNFINYGRSVAAMPSEAKTYRDVLRWICELAGTNGYISYDGNFYMTWYRDASGFTITTANRTASEIDENTFAITGVTIIKDETTYTAGTNVRPLIIQDNPLATSNLSTIADNIATYRNGFTWTPFSATVLPAPHLYPLDHCTFVKKDNTNADVYITTVTYKLNGNTTIAGTGDAKHKGRSYGLQDSTFYANNIAAGAITADKVSAGAITADKIAANAITTEKIDPSVDMATNAGVAATYATKAAAASSNQRIYYRTSSSTAPTAPTTWVTSTSTANNTWSTKRMQYDSTYKYLWTCIQTKTVSGTVTNSTVLLDDTTTVIDGGNIITGTVDANQIKAGAITAEKINSSVDMATNAGVAATYATKTNAVKREQRIYRKNNSTTAPTAPTSWITSTSVTSSAWTTKRMSYDASYPYLWTCLQTETNDGTISCSTVLLDDTLTVIDGGKIITGSVAANAVNVTDLSAFNATIGGWTIGSSQILKEITTDGYVYQVCLNAPASPTAGNWAIGVRRRATDSQTWTYLSYFNYGGKLYSQNAEIAGKVTTSEGSIGDWTIDSYGLSKTVEESGSSYYTNISAGRYPLSLGKNDGLYGESTHIQFDSKNAVQDLVKRINNTEKFQYATLSGGGLSTYIREYDGSYASWDSGGKADLTPTQLTFNEDESIDPASWSHITKDELEIYNQSPYGLTTVDAVGVTIKANNSRQSSFDVDKLTIKGTDMTTLVTTTVTTLTNGTSNSGSGGVYYERWGHQVHVHVAVTGITANTNTTIFTLPSALQPSTIIFALGVGASFATPQVVQGYVSTGGNVVVRSPGTEARIDFTYMV